MTRAVGWLVTLAVPVVLVAVNVRLLASEAFLRWEYARPGFPAAEGFTGAERLAVAVPSTRFILNADDPATLAALRHGGRPLYTPGEIAHLVDVRRVVAGLTWLAILGLVAVGALAFGAGRGRRWGDLALPLARGGWLAIGLVAGVGLGVGVAWPWFFTTFHEVFFAPGTWEFPVDSGLIRLFPGRFWYDTAVILAGLTAAEAAGVIAAARTLVRRAR